MKPIFWSYLSQSLFQHDVIAPTIHYDGRLPSPLPVSELLAETTGLAAVALAKLRTQSPQEVIVDGRLCGFWSLTSCTPIGWTPHNTWDPLSSIFKGVDGWIRLHTNASNHKKVAIKVLGDVTSEEAAATVIANREVADLERCIIESGGAAAHMITWDKWKNHPQGKAVAEAPLIEWFEKLVPASDKLRSANYLSDRPLSHLKVLDLTRVLAGPVATRTLAGYGADVLRIDPENWDDSGLLHDTTVGKRCAKLDLHKVADRKIFEGLLKRADVLVHGYRPGALANLGYDQIHLGQIQPTLIDVSLSAYGCQGPWAERRGYDSLVQFSSGIADICSDVNGKPGKLPVQALDHVAGHLIAAIIFRSLHRAKEGQVMSVRISLARIARLLCEAQYGTQIVEPIPPLDDRDFSDDIEYSAWGMLRRLRPSTSVPGAPIRWDIPSGNLRRHLPKWHRE